MPAVDVVSYPRTLASWRKFIAKPAYVPRRGLLVEGEGGVIKAWKSFTKFPNVHEIVHYRGVDDAFRGIKKAFRKRDGTLIIVRKIRGDIYVHTKSSIANSFSVFAGHLLREEVVREIPGDVALMFELTKWHEDIARKIREELKRKLGVEFELDEIPASVGILPPREQKRMLSMARELAETDWEKELAVDDPYLLLAWKEGRIEFKFLGARVFQWPAVFRGKLTFDSFVLDENSELIPPDEYAHRDIATRVFPNASVVERDFELEEKLDGLGVMEIVKMRKARLPIEGWVLWVDADPVEWTKTLVPSLERVGSDLPAKKFWQVDRLLKLKSMFYVKVIQHYDIASLRSTVNEFADDLPREFVAKVKEFYRRYEALKARINALLKKVTDDEQRKQLLELKRGVVELLKMHGDELDEAFRELEEYEREVERFSNRIR